MLTSAICGGAWVGIILVGRQRRLTIQNRELLEDRQRTLDEFQALSQRLLEAEDRLEFAERLLAKPPEPVPDDRSPASDD